MEMIEKQIETLIKELSPETMQEIIDIPEITACDTKLHPQLLVGPRKEKIIREIYPISQRWEMVHAIGASAHFWQLEDMKTGNYRWLDDPTVDISDIWIQAYKNGWIIIVRNAQDIRGVYDPDRVARIETLKKEIKERDLKEINARIAWAAMSQNPMRPDLIIFPDMPEISEQITKIAKTAMQIARKEGITPFDACEKACAQQEKRYPQSPQWEDANRIDAYQFRSFLMTQEVTKAYNAQMEAADEADEDDGRDFGLHIDMTHGEDPDMLRQE